VAQTTLHITAAHLSINYSWGNRVHGACPMESYPLWKRIRRSNPQNFSILRITLEIRKSQSIHAQIHEAHACVAQIPQQLPKIFYEGSASEELELRHFTS